MDSFVKYWRRPRSERALLLHALVLHGVVAIIVRTVRPSRACRWLRLVYRQRPPEARGHAWERIVWAIRTVTGVVPVGKTCLTVAVTADCLLRRGGCDAMVRFGVAGIPAEGSTLKAHAWIEHAGQAIMGGETTYVPLQQPRREVC